MDISVRLKPNKRVEAEVDGFTIVTDQPSASGGEGHAPDPFTLFLSSMATCAGFYVSAFCATRGISTEGIDVTQHSDKDRSGKLSGIHIHIALPSTFPAEQVDAIVRAAASCKVKKTLLAPPEVQVTAGRHPSIA